jgi:hypothetical protein
VHGHAHTCLAPGHKTTWTYLSTVRGHEYLHFQMLVGSMSSILFIVVFISLCVHLIF